MLTQQGVDEYKAALAREEPDAADIADDIEDERNIPSWAATYWDGFAELTNDRPSVSETQTLPSLPGATPVMFTVSRELAIPFTSIDSYATRYGIAGDAFETFRHLIRAMDREYLKIAAEQRAGRSTSESEIDGD